MNDKIMSESNLDSTVGRLTACIAMMVLVHTNIPNEGDVTEALYGYIEFLSSICRDFEADIAGAEDYIPAAEVVV